MMKGIILAAGRGSRMHPHTHATNKCLLPVGDVPMIVHPLKCLINAGIREICIVTGGDHFDAIAKLLGSGQDLKHLGITVPVSLAYRVQDSPRGSADAIGLARMVVGENAVAVLFGDNIYQDSQVLNDAVASYVSGGHIFLKEVPDELLFEDNKGIRKAKYGMATLQGDKVINIEEKPQHPKSNFAVTGAYLYDKDVFDVVSTLKPSARGELEITDVNNHYINKGTMRSSVIKGWWTDAGSPNTYALANKLLWEKE